MDSQQHLVYRVMKARPEAETVAWPVGGQCRMAAAVLVEVARLALSGALWTPGQGGKGYGTSWMGEM